MRNRTVSYRHSECRLNCALCDGPKRLLAGCIDDAGCSKMKQTAANVTDMVLCLCKGVPCVLLCETIRSPIYGSVTQCIGRRPELQASLEDLKDSLWEVRVAVYRDQLWEGCRPVVACRIARLGPWYWPSLHIILMLQVLDREQRVCAGGHGCYEFSLQ